MSFVIDTQSIDPIQIETDLLNWISSQQSPAWKDYYIKSSTGRILLKYLAGLSAFLAFQEIVGRREAYLRSAIKRSSIVGTAQTFGYSVNRGKNTHFTLTVTPYNTSNLPIFTIVGTSGDYELILAQQTSLIQGVQTEIEVIVGRLQTETVTASTEDLIPFKFTSTGMSEDIRILLDGTEVEYDTNMLSLINDKYVAISNPIGGIDVLYLQADDGAYRYVQGSELLVEFVELITADITFEITTSTFDYGTLDNMVEYSAKQEPESEDEIKVNAPLYHESQTVVRGRKDYLKIFKRLDTAIIQTGGVDPTPSVTYLTYIKSDTSLYSTAEKANFIQQLSDYRPFGIALPSIFDPVQVVISLDIQVTIDITFKGTYDVAADVRTVLETYEKKLKLAFDVYQIENDINNYAYTKYARVTVVCTRVDGNPTSPDPKLVLDWNEYYIAEEELTIS